MEDVNEYLAYNMIRGSDIYLVPLCLALMYILASVMRKKYRNTPAEQYIIPALTLRFVGAFIYTLVIGYYYGFGDSQNYYQGVLDMHKAVTDDYTFLTDIYTKAELEDTDRIYSYFLYDDYENMD